MSSSVTLTRGVLFLREFLRRGSVTSKCRLSNTERRLVVPGPLRVVAEEESNRSAKR